MQRCLSTCLVRVNFSMLQVARCMQATPKDVKAIAPIVDMHAAIRRLFCAWLCWAAGMMSNAAVGVMLQKHLGHVTLGPVLYDIGFELLPHIPSRSLGFSLPDVFALLTATVTAARLVISFPPHLSLIILRRILFISSLAYLSRAVSCPCTLLPNPDSDCLPVLFQSDFLSIVSIPFGVSITCSDCFFSGHSIPITCSFLVWLYYTPWSLSKMCGLSLSIFSLFGLILTHFHYTIDVLYGFVVTSTFWAGYHLVLSCPSLLASSRVVTWWESVDAIGTCTGDFGIEKNNFASDPRLLWSYSPGEVVTVREKGLTRTQVLLLLIVVLTLSPSWIAIYQSITIYKNI
jgi:hypothetical protein